ncbi:MAG: hypothetical protein KKG99_03735 [Bacteroidetes bacterium]|nr:hypothetical protein [Bacteroidota bacterium]
MTKGHSFHIPVMGVGYTIDTPVKVAQFGIDSVISLLDDKLLEKMREMYCEKFEIPYQQITEKFEDFRAKRITSYLNLVNELAEKKFEEFKSSAIQKGNDLKEFFNSLPDSSTLKQEFKGLVSKHINLDEIKTWINENFSMGTIDVNIMTKVDKDNYIKGEKQPTEFNDAHAALRGFANSNLKSSVVLSAGMNPRLYGYIEQFEDFYPDKNGQIKKKIILKVSDFKSAIIQGKYLAKKGLWISEYRVESGLNCGGHAFATEGYLLGPILAEFRDQRKELVQTVHELLVQALAAKNKPVPEKELPLKITAQGGVGTAEEHQFLIDHYQVDSVGWGTPFLLVPEATTIDEATIEKLIDAKEEDLYLSNISPLGIPFNNLRTNTKDLEKLTLIRAGRPGSACPKRYAALNNEFDERGLCIASRKYQKIKIANLDKEGLSTDDYKKKYNQIVEKACICNGLGTSAMIANKMNTKIEGTGISICPGPNMAYFSKKMSLKEIIDHIYGRSNMISRTDRPNMFVKELGIYIDYLKERIEETKTSMTAKQEKYFESFEKNLEAGISYYQKMFGEMKGKFEDAKTNILRDLDMNLKALQNLKIGK